jgi:hypothetical protein
MSGILWIIVVGFIAGIIARMLSPGPNNPSGDRPLRPGPGRGLHHRHDRRADRAVHLESAGRAWGDSGLE